ncbi:MAG TPA: hypothetical protein VFZ81_05760 [Burkholderiales bacterium]
MRRLLATAGVNLALVLLPFLLLEGAFRLLPVTYLPQLMPVSAQAPVARFQPNVEYPWSRDWNFSVVTRKRSNNYGFIHAADYEAHKRGPLLAVIGDSLVEAQQVDAGHSVGDLLDAAVGGAGRVYSLGMSGAPLSQYLVYAEYARKTFGADALAIVVAPNDYDESLLKYKADPRFHYFDDDGTLRRRDYELSGTRRILRHSAVLRFIMYNLDAGLRLEALWKSMRGQTVSAESGAALERRLADSRRAVDYFLDQLPARTGLGRESIVFVVDPLRPALYDDDARAQADRGYFGRMTRHFAQAAAARGYQVIDLERVFLPRYKLDGTRFEAAPTDSHWSALGHRVVAEEIRKSAAFTRTFRQVPARPPNSASDNAAAAGTPRSG